LLFPANVTAHIAQIAFEADKLIRFELAQGWIAGENDYTSNLTAQIRRQINASNHPNLIATSLVLPRRIETRCGADACIILANQHEFKVCLFEAKLPRLRAPRGHHWDYLQGNPRTSHFDSQLDRQSLWNTFAIWEMFYSEYAFCTQPNSNIDFTSTCVWHHAAMSLRKARPNIARWSNHELADMLTTYGESIFDMVTAVCNCVKGKPILGRNFIGAFDEEYVPRNILLIDYNEDGPIPRNND